MNIRPLSLTLVLLAAMPFTGQCAELGVLSPVLVDGKPQEQAAPTGDMAPVVTQLTEGALFDKLQREAREGFTATSLQLDESAQRIAGTPPRPTWLYLSLEEGGFPRHGFWLQDATGRRFVDEPFVDLVVDENSLEDGSFEEIFAHELGHVMLRRLLHLPQGYSHTPHHSFSMTDTPTAFDEGFATHFQALARHLTRNPKLRLEDDGLAGKPFVTYWLSNLDRTHRIDGVRRNLFVQRQVALPGESAVAGLDNSTMFDTARLKSGDQMMASEGVVATVFFRWLVPGPTGNLRERYERLFTSLAMLDKETKLEPDSPILVRVLQGYAKAQPQYGADAVRVFLETTYASTVDPALARQTEALARSGRMGVVTDVEKFVTLLKSSRTALNGIVETTVRAPEKLDAALSTPIWLYAEVPVAGQDKPEPLAVNLNIAEPEHLQALPGIARELAGRIVTERDAHGPYASLAALYKRVPMPARASTAFTGFNKAALQAGTNTRR